MNQPLVSIVINNYNYGEFLCDAINSALHQTSSNTEVIVVDDGSTDSSPALISSYGDRVIPVFKENGGQASAFNAGFAASKGDIIIFLDADDYLLKDAVERVLGVWHPTVSKVHYKLQVINGAGDSLNYTHPPGELDSGDVHLTLLERGIYTTPPTSGNAFTRSVLAKILPIPESEFPRLRGGTETYMQAQVPFYGQVVAIGEPLGAYRIHGKNTTALAGDVDAKWIRRLVHHDVMQQDLLRNKATELGYQVPPDLDRRHIAYLWSRLASLRLDPKNHPVAGDQAVKLMIWGLRLLWKEPQSLKRRVLFSVWFIAVGVLPLPLAKIAIVWLFSPHARPKFLKGVRSFVNT